MNTSTELARSIIRRMISHGITDAVLSPGSRNAPLSIALFTAEQHGLINLHVQIDERSAGFFALGISKASGRPVALICTSGTAVANYHPAVLEAWHSQIPLLVITADRPARLRQTGANQTTLQIGIFRDCTHFVVDIESVNADLMPAFAALMGGPIHLNVQFDDPMLPDDERDWLAGLEKAAYLSTQIEKIGKLEIESARGILVVGHDRAGFTCGEVAEFAALLGWPLIAEDPISFEHAIAHASLFLTSPKARGALKPDTAIVIGRTTLSRSTNAAIKSARREIVIDPRIAKVDPKRAADEIFLGLPELAKKFVVDQDWNSQWVQYSRRTAEILEVIDGWSEPVIARELVPSLPPASALYISSSRPIRDIEGFALPRLGIETFANRGLAGIDGNISTALGIASQRRSTTALIGDLSFLHDHNGLLSAHRINLRICVINNDGGGIFSTLPQFGLPGFERIFGTPHGRDLVAIGLAMGIPSVSVSSLKELRKAFSRPIEGVSIVIAQVPSREENAKRLRELYAEIEDI